MDKIIEAKDLVKKYGDNLVMDGLSLDVYKGETLVILGRSGVGKSVLLKLIIGLEKPFSGSLKVDNQNLLNLKGPELYSIIKEMGMLFQGGALFDSLTVFENTAFYLRQHERMAESEIKDRVEDALKMVELDGSEYVMPSDLSGGMRKRAALARLIVYRPKILLYDEPTTGLDPITAMHINELIVKTQEELKATSIVVTHDLKSAITTGDRIALQHDNKIAYIDDKKNFFESQNPVIKAFLENAIPKEVFNSHG